MNSSRIGTAAELRAQQILEQDGFVVGQRRHVAGPGDLLAVCLEYSTWSGRTTIRARLIEVKRSGRGPYQDFPPADREAMVAYAHAHRMEAELWWFQPGDKFPQIIPSSEWPQ